MDLEDEFLVYYNRNRAGGIDPSWFPQFIEEIFTGGNFIHRW